MQPEFQNSRIPAATLVTAASQLIHDFELRRDAHTRIAGSGALEDPGVAAIGVSCSEAASVLLLFGPDGSLVSVKQLGGSELVRGPIAPVADFDIGYTCLVVPEGSELEACACDTGVWVADAAALRAYDPGEDERATGRLLLLEVLATALQTGDLRPGPELDQHS